MREIKFRGKTLDGQWVNGDLLHIGKGVAIAQNFQLGEELPESSEYALTYTEDEIAVVIPDTIGQFTGLHDKNGKEIYEGDIVKQTWGSPHFVNDTFYDCFGRIGDIRYECDLVGVHTKDGMYRLVNIGVSKTVIGNIHDNPELLNK